MIGQRGETFGDLLRELRVDAGLTQEELAERAGLSVRGISDLERGVNRFPYRSTVLRLVEALGLEDKQARALQDHASRRKGPQGRPSEPTLHRLPVPPTPLIGREREVEMVVHLLNREGHRLVTLTGTGGVGKTRLALEVVHRVAGEYADGAGFVSLATLTDPALVPSTMATALGITLSPTASPDETLQRVLAEREMLLLLDNLEQIVEVAPYFAELLAGCPTLKLLVTSRVPLHIRGEQQIEIDPLSVRGDDGACQGEEPGHGPAIELFLQRAGAVRSATPVDATDVELVTEICRRLDGIPLAIELAAAQVRYYPLHRLLEQLHKPLRVLRGGPRDLPARQQTMRDSIAWTYDLLGAEEQELFRALSVFAGGATEEAIEALWQGAGTTTRPAAELLQSLLDASLLQARETDNGALRYHMFETIRQFAADELEMRGESERAHEQHARFIQALVETADSHLATADRDVWLPKLGRELDNIRAALAWCVERHEAELGLRIGAELWRFWFGTGFREGRAWMDGLLRLPERASVPLDVRAAALNAAGAMAYGQAAYEEARRFWDESLMISRQRGDEAATATALNGLGALAADMSDYHAARELLQESSSIRRRLHDVYGLGATLTNLANVHLYEGDLTTARTLHEEGLALYREVGSAAAIANALDNLSLTALQRGEYDRAEALAQESLATARAHELPGAAPLITLGVIALEQGNAVRARALLQEALIQSEPVENDAEIAMVLINLSAVHRLDGRLGEARDGAQRGLALKRERGDDKGAADALLSLGDIARLEGHLAEAASHYWQALSSDARIGYRHGISLCLERAAWLAAGDAAPNPATTLAGAAAALRNRMGVVLSPIDRADHETMLTLLREFLPGDEFDRAWERGYSMALDDATATAENALRSIVGDIARLDV